MVQGQLCQTDEGVEVTTSQSQAITTTKVQSVCATFSACNAQSTGGTATQTTTLSCDATPNAKGNTGSTSVPLPLQARVDSPAACEESFPTIIYPLNPFSVDAIVQYLEDFQAKKRAGGDTTFRYVVIDSPSLGFTAFYWVSAMTPSEKVDIWNQRETIMVR